MQTVLRLLARTPLPALYLIAHAVVGFAFHAVRWRRTVAATNLALAFPELDKAERDRVLRQSYRNLAELIAEAIWGFGATAQQIRERVTIENSELIARHAASGRSVVLLAAHFCNWEWLLLAAGARLELPIDAVYKPQKVEGVDRFIREARARFGGNPIPHKRFAAEVIKRRRQVRAYAMVADQTPLRQDVRHWSRFLGRDTAFFAGAGKIARLLQAPVLYVTMRRVRRGHYTARLLPLAEPTYDRDADSAIIDRYARTLEGEIRLSPPDWLWVHNKWKYARPSQD